MKFNREKLEEMASEMNILTEKYNAILGGFYWQLKDEYKKYPEHKTRIRWAFGKYEEPSAYFTAMGDGEQFDVGYDNTLEVYSHDGNGNKVKFDIPIEWFDMGDVEAQKLAKDQIKKEVSAFVEKLEFDKKTEKERLISNVKNHPEYESIMAKLIAKELK